MKKWKKITTAVLAAVAALGVLTFSAYAEEPKKITSVSLTITSGVQPGMEPNIEDVFIEPKGTRYTVVEKKFLNGDDIWKTSDSPKIQMTLKAGENQYFELDENNKKTKGVRLFGDLSYFESANRHEDPAYVDIIINLQPLSQTMGSIREINWTATGYANWNYVNGADHYEMRVYRDNVITTSNIETSTQYFDFSYTMKTQGVYSVEVRPVSKFDSNKKGEWFKSEPIVVSVAEADRFKNGNPPVGWIYTGSVWRYRNSNSSYSKEKWQQIDEKWYYFNENGDLLTDTVTPDGYKVDENGVWIVE